MLEIKKILFPCDLEESSSKIMPYVLSVSEKYNCMIYLLHVVKDLPLWSVCYIPYPSSWDELLNKALEVSQKALDIVREEKMQDHPNVIGKVVSGDPATKILNTIEAEDINLVIMGTHGRKGFDHAIFGSVAEKVVKKSPVPVLVINTFNHQ